MKKLFLILVFMVPLSLLNAKSDIQITSPFVSFFNKFCSVIDILLYIVPAVACSRDKQL